MRETIRCPMCQTADSQPWTSEGGWDAVRCDQCSCVYVSPRPSLSEITSASKTGLHPVEHGVFDSRARYSKAKVRKCRERFLEIFTIEELAQPGLRWLDIGCGYGESLLALRGLCAPTSDIIGLEPSDVKRDVARRYGLQVVGTGLDQVEGGFDVVSSINVFSHLPDPIGFFRHASDLIKPSGSLVIVTGNAGDLPPNLSFCAQPYDFPDHLVFASSLNLETLVSTLSMRVHTWREHSGFYSSGGLLDHARELARVATGRRPPGRRPQSVRSIMIRAVR